MKKETINLLALLAVCLFIGCAFTACGDDKKDEITSDDLVERLQGSWTFETMKINVMGQTIEMDADDLRDDTGYDQFYDEYLSFNGEYVNGSKYYVDGNKVLLPWYEELDWWSKVSFSGSKMTMYYDITSEGVRIKLWTVYVKGGGRGGDDFVGFEGAPSIVEKALRFGTAL